MATYVLTYVSRFTNDKLQRTKIVNLADHIDVYDWFDKNYKQFYIYYAKLIYYFQEKNDEVISDVIIGNGVFSSYEIV